MSFDNHYPNRKDRRSRYWDSRQFDRGCRASDGACTRCASGRQHHNRRREPIVFPEEFGPFHPIPLG